MLRKCDNHYQLLHTVAQHNTSINIKVQNKRLLLLAMLGNLFPTQLPDSPAPSTLPHGWHFPILPPLCWIKMNAEAPHKTLTGEKNAYADNATKISFVMKTQTGQR